MDAITELLALLEQKHQQFEKYKEYSQILLECDSETMTDYITKRGALAIEIDAVNEKITAACATCENSALLTQILQLACNYSDVPPDLQPLFSMSQQIFAQINYIAGLNEQIMHRAEAERDEAKTHLVEKQNTPKIVRYLTNLTPTQEDGALTISHKKA